MPLLFKIFVFLLLKHGLSDKGSATLSDPNVSGFRLPVISVLRIEGEAPLLEQAVFICQQASPEQVQTAYNILPGQSNVTISFIDLTIEKKQLLMSQLQHRATALCRMEWQ